MKLLILRCLTFICCLCCTASTWAAINNEPLTGEAYTLTDQAYQAISRHADDEAEKLIIQAKKIQPDSYQLAMLLLDTEMRLNKWDAARKLAEELLTILPQDAYLLANCGFIAQFQQRNIEAVTYFQAALQYTGLDSSQRLNVQKSIDSLQPPQSAHSSVTDSHALLNEAYRLLREHNEEGALSTFQTAFSIQAGTPGQYADAAYTAKHLNKNDVAIELLKKALAADMNLPASQQPFTVQQVFNYRRDIQQMNRSWGANTTLTYQNNTFTSTSKLNTLQGGAEIYWQPNDFAGNHNGHVFQVFTGVSETMYDAQGGKTGSSTAQANFGIRYKPFSTLGLVLVAQRLLPLGNAAGNSDTLLRAAYSNGMGNDLNVQHPDWKTWQYYAESAYFVQARRSYNSFEGNYGQAYHYGQTHENLLWIPHAVLAANYDSAEVISSAVSIGPGVKVRYWMREDAYNAPASWLELNIQYRYELTNTNRMKGLLMRAMYMY